MQHAIPVDRLFEKLGPQIEEMAAAVEACVHCGFCLPTCPTYQVLGEEMDSPRGRILLMKSVLEDRLSIQEAMPYIDRCLGCLACVTACPSGVEYGSLVSPFQAYAQDETGHSVMVSAQRLLVRETLPYPDRFRSAAALGRMAQPLRKALPGELQSLLEMLPERLPEAQTLPEIVPAEGRRRARVALLAGCVQQVIAPEINWATIRVLTKNGVEVVIPESQTCCGAILNHIGDTEGARRLARQNLAALPKDVDVIVTNAAGCGSGMKEYGSLFHGLDEEVQSHEFASKVMDVSEFLVQLGMIAPPPLPIPMRAAYHDACHLAHAQGVVDAPRTLLRAIPNLTLYDIEDWETCCGSAGTYNLEQPEIASELGRRKVKNIQKSGGEVVVTGNIGCMVQIQKYLSACDGRPMSVYHTVQVLDMAYQGI
jgi:glycolate oxidase iron-sulfur subunit